MAAGVERKIVVRCRRCSQQLRFPRRRATLIITCPKCLHKFEHRSTLFSLDPSGEKLAAGLVGGFLGFLLVEVAEASSLLRRDPYQAAAIATACFGTCLGSVLGGADGFFMRDRTRLVYGLKIGALLGSISGAFSGLIAQWAFSNILSSTLADQQPSFGLMMSARVVGWCILGILIGGSYGLKENTSGDLKYGLIGGGIGGAIGGLLFDPIASAIQVGNGTFGRLAGFSILGMAIGASIIHLKERAIRRNQPEMYRQLTTRLPSNPRLMLPEPGPRQSPPFGR